MIRTMGFEEITEKKPKDYDGETEKKGNLKSKSSFSEPDEMSIFKSISAKPLRKGLHLRYKEDRNGFKKSVDLIIKVAAI